MAEPIEIDVWQGEIAELEVDAVVVAASESLFMTAGAATSVKRRAGAEVERAAVEQGPIAPGTAVATTGGELPAPCVIRRDPSLAAPDQIAEFIRWAFLYTPCRGLILR